MNKLLSYCLVFIVGMSAGILFWSNVLDKDKKPVHPDPMLPVAISSQSNTYRLNMRQINSQQFSDVRHTAITEAVRAVSPAVVGINVLQIRQYRSPDWMFDDPFFRYFFPERSEQIVKGLGSGFIISSDGYIVTNQHVVDQAAEIVATLPNGKKYEAELVASDYISDIALLKINAREPLPFANLGDSGDLIIGEWVIAIGNPFGLFDMGQPSVSQGIISATDRDFGKQQDSRVYKDMIQTDAAINSGNSGGPLVNSLGQVIGINTFIFSGSEHTGTSIGLGFAIPINHAKKIIGELRRYGNVNRRFRTGLEIENLTPSLARYLGKKDINGAVISHIEPNSPADQAHLQVGDVIIEINGFPVKTARDPMRIIEDIDAKGGDILTLKVFRNKRIITIFLGLEELR